jgi:hypothetical protein
MAGFESISTILGKFSPAQRLIALILLLLTILGISFFQFSSASKPECETVQKQLMQTQNQLTSTISSQNTFIQTISELRQQTFDLNYQLTRRDSIISVLGRRYELARRPANLETPNQIERILDSFEIEPMMLQKSQRPINEEDPETIPASYPTPILDTISERSESIDTLKPTIPTDTIIAQGKVSWVRRLLGYQN